MAVMSPTNAKVHFKAYDGQVVDALGNSVISTSNVTMTSAQAELGQESAYIPDNGRVTFSNTNLFNVGAGDFTMGFWWRPDDWAVTDGWKRVFSTNGDNTGYVGPFVIDFNTATGRLHFKVESAVDFVGSEIGQPEYLEELFNYQLPAGANTWYHIMVTRDNARQETTLFVNGSNTAGSIQYGFELSTSNNPTLGAEPGYSNAASGYFQDFFWMNEALDRTINSQHFIPGFTENALAFTNSAPSISSFSSSADSAEDGDSVTLSWSVSGETNLQLLKYVGNVLDSTEDVLGLSSKQVTITETVSYKLRATNDNGSVDSASVEIQLSQGGNSMANVYHWLNGNNTDQINGVDLIAYGEAASIANSSRWYGGTNNAFRIGHTSGGRAVEYTAYGAEDALENVGTGDFTVMFWWKPNDASFGGGSLKHHFISSPDVVKIANYGPSGNTAASYDLRAYYRYGAGTQTSKAYNINLTGNPWIRIYFSRIAGVFTYVLYDADGNILNDNSGNPCYFVNAGQAGNIYDATNADPHIRIGGNFAYGKSAGGFYDDIIWSQGYGIAYDAIQTHTDGYHIVPTEQPVINSFSTSAASATNGSSVTLSWNVDYGDTLELLKYVGGLLTDTETVTGQVSKSVTISETVSYKLRATNGFGSVDSQSVQIQLSQGGNNMALPDNNVVIQGSMLATADVSDAIVVSKSGSVLLGDSTLAVELAGVHSRIGALQASQDAALAAVQADVDQNEADSDAAHAAATTDRAAVRSEFAAADSALETSMLAAIAVVQADVDQNESDADAAIAAEEARALAAEGVLSTAISAEETRALAAEAALQADVDQNEADSDAAHAAATTDRADIRSEFAAADSALETSMLAAIAVVQADVDQNESDADAAIAALQADVDQNEADADAAISAEEARALAAEGVLSTAISAEETRALAAEGVLSTAISAEETRALAAEGVLSAAISAEETRALAAEAALQADVDQNEADSDAAHAAATTDRADIRSEFAAADSALETSMLAAIAVVQADVDQNESDADAAIAALQADVDQNESDADAAIAALQADVDGNEADGDADRALIRTEFAAADSALQAAINAVQVDVDGNEADAESMFDKHESAIGLEADGTWGGFSGTNYVDSASSLKDGTVKLDIQVNANAVAVAAEETRALAAEGVLSAAISAEETRALAAEGVLSAAISAEETRALAAEAGLGTRLDNMKAGDSSEAFTTLMFTANGGKEYTMSVDANDQLVFAKLP